MSDTVVKAADPAPAARHGSLLLGLRAGAIALVVVLGAVLLGHGLRSGFDLESLLGTARDTPWAPLATLAVFIVLGQTGFPQFLMIAGAVMVFGPVLGFGLSWTGTMISSSLGFLLGHLFGGELLRRFGGAKINGMSEKLGRHGIVAIMVLRNVPAGPFVAVNMMAGLSHITWRKFVIGTALGILPKMIFIAFLGAGFSRLLQERSILAIVLIAAVVAVWVVAMIWMRRKARHWTRPEDADTIALNAGGPEQDSR